MAIRINDGPPGACAMCDDSGIVTVLDKPVTCDCEVGRNAKAANPDWLCIADVDNDCSNHGPFKGFECPGCKNGESPFIT